MPAIALLAAALRRGPGGHGMLLAAIPLGCTSKNQLARRLNVIAPPQGPKSVAGVRSAPACPRAWSVFAQSMSAWVPPFLNEKPPGPPKPASEPVNDREPTKTI